MLLEENLFGIHDKVETAIGRLRAFEPPEGYFVAFSGGKDSQCISGRIGDTENRISRVLFKQSVELAMLMHVVAATHAIRPEDLESLRKMCVGEVSKVNGKFHFDDAVKLQKK